jgi:two-component system chemotaxis sensor kinase CheA
MSIDMNQFHGVFFDESEEHLVEMEEVLMTLSVESPNPEDLNCIFRAAHSIKGGSGIFGFDALTGLTHVMESLLDQARKGQTHLTTPIVNTLLTTGDLLRAILNSYRNKEDIDWTAIEAGTQALNAVIDDNKSAQNSEENEQGFGFFTPIVSSEINEDVDFGFFDENEFSKNITDEGVSSSSSDENSGFGFFEPLDAVVEQEIKTPISSEHESVVQDDSTKTKSSNTVKSSSKKTVVKETNSLRVDTQKIDSLVNLVGELVITQSMLKLASEDVFGPGSEKLQEALEILDRNVRQAQETAMSMRMLPMSFVFNRFPRVVRDLSAKLDKEVDLVIEGSSAEIDKGLIEKLVDPLTHLVRNSIDHGIELPAKRLAAGKPQVGKVTLKAEQGGGSILISIVDDGAGLDKQKILEKAKQNGIETHDKMPDSDIWKLIFAAGFSTATEVTDVSGRGVGMDVVKQNIESIGGQVEIESELGKGSRFIIRLPLTLAILDGICVSVGDQVFIIPLTQIVESIQPVSNQIKTLVNEQMLWIRDAYWPILPLYEYMNIQGAESDPTQAIVVLITTANKRFGLLVDGLVGQQQVVIKSLEHHYKPVPGVAGATIMGDGSVAFILDVESLASTVNQPSVDIEVKIA